MILIIVNIVIKEPSPQFLSHATIWQTPQLRPSKANLHLSKLWLMTDHKKTLINQSNSSVENSLESRINFRCICVTYCRKSNDSRGIVSRLIVSTFIQKPIFLPKNSFQSGYYVVYSGTTYLDLVDLFFCRWFSPNYQRWSRTLDLSWIVRLNFFPTQEMMTDRRSKWLDSTYGFSISEDQF